MNIVASVRQGRADELLPIFGCCWFVLNRSPRRSFAIFAGHRREMVRSDAWCGPNPVRPIIVVEAW